MTEKPYIYDYRKGYALDTEAKVRWANELPPEASTGRPWKLGDTCYYRPREEKNPAFTEFEQWG